MGEGEEEEKEDTRCRENGREREDIASSEVERHLASPGIVVDQNNTLHPSLGLVRL